MFGDVTGTVDNSIAQVRLPSGVGAIEGPSIWSSSFHHKHQLLPLNNSQRVIRFFLTSIQNN
jgi:hypothetical protein